MHRRYNHTMRLSQPQAQPRAQPRPPQQYRQQYSLSARRIQALLCAMLGLIMTACTTPAGIKLHAFAEHHHLRIEKITTDKHTLYGFTDSQTNAHMHVYLEGDGNPWFRGREPAIDPTTKYPLALKLMLRDPHPSVYLNRPCYAALQPSAKCDSTLWTSGRYSNEVIQTMGQALDHIKETYHVQRFTVFGHSGGANIALLLANQRDDIDKVVTIAGNIDHPRWTDYFNYLPLNTSLNAQEKFPLRKDIERWHLIGGKDYVVPAHITQAAAQKDSGANIMVLENYDHRCCWETTWPELLKRVGATSGHH